MRHKVTNQNPNPNEEEKIYDRINSIKDEICDLKDYINSDICQQCTRSYARIAILEQELGGLKKKLIVNDQQ